MTSRGQAITLIVHGVLIVAVLAAATVLAWHKSIGEQATVGIIEVVLGLIGGSAGTLAVQAFVQPPPQTVQVQASEPATPVAP
jgi:hypothetical protein